MKEFYSELIERLDYLRTLEQTEENKGRMKEIELAIVRVQQILISEFRKTPDEIQ